MAIIDIGPPRWLLSRPRCLYPVSVAQDFQDRDTREISSYVLTEPALAKYSLVTRNLGALPPRSNSCDDEGAQSLDEVVALMRCGSDVQAAITSAGMTTREYVVFSCSLFQNGMASWALSQPGGKLPAGTSMANVNFHRAHEAAIQKLDKKTKASDCDDADSEIEEEVEE